MKPFLIVLLLVSAALAFDETEQAKPKTQPKAKAPAKQQAQAKPQAHAKVPADAAKQACHYGEKGCPQRPEEPVPPGLVQPPWLESQRPEAPQGPPKKGFVPSAQAFANQKPPKQQSPLVAPVWEPQPKMECAKFKSLSNNSAFRCGADGKMEVLTCADTSYRFIYTSQNKPMCMAPPPKMPHDQRNPELSYPYGLAKKPGTTK